MALWAIQNVHVNALLHVHTQVQSAIHVHVNVHLSENVNEIPAEELRLSGI